MYSFGMGTRDIQRHLQQVYGVEVPAETVSNIADAVVSDVRKWQKRPLEKSCPILFPDALRVNSRQDGKNVNKVLHVTLSINWKGRKEDLGLWLADTECVKFWMGVLTDIKKTRDGGHPHSLHGRVHGLPRRGEGRLSRHARPALRRPHDPQFHEICFLQGFEGRMSGISGKSIRRPVQKPTMKPWKDSAGNGMANIR